VKILLVQTLQPQQVRLVVILILPILARLVSVVELEPVVEKVEPLALVIVLLGSPLVPGMG
jgi:hypothetical protein